MKDICEFLNSYSLQSMNLYCISVLFACISPTLHTTENHTIDIIAQ